MNLILSTNFDSYLTYRETLKAAKDSIKHFGQGERVRFNLIAFHNKPDHPEAFRANDLPFKDPWYKDKNVLLEVLRYWHEQLKDKLRYQIFAYLEK